MSEFFVHPTSIVDENVEIGEGTKSGISAIFNPVLELERTVPLDRM